ncbi:uncharacterized protein ATNIH1004_002977 [Aspergillus tanneri]|uniref:Uncharacterized protein n=1 Tax=Aspergillus tanneri TaxID=1220188 RepID=A0A5M9MY53_9EURO|nr:uncharacterized protein ATNIH1004_002977 [Aspergillus tanneri]KAA8650294.1 hypothetical protein ATNIH1004_002977 [Aspergillus tanneri]
MNRQTSYNGPLVMSLSLVPKPQYGTAPFPRSSLPSSFSSSIPSGPMNHPLPPKPPTPRYFFHEYTPRAGNVGTTPPVRDVGESHLADNSFKLTFSDYEASASKIRTLDSLKTEDVSLPSGEDTSQEYESDCNETSSVNIDIDDLPHPDTLFSWAQSHDTWSCKSSAPTGSLDDGIGRTNQVTSETPRTGPSSRESPGHANDSYKDDDNQ